MTRGFASLSKAMLRGFVRDRTALFFTVLFPLMFLVLFGGLFKDQGAPRVQIEQIGAVPVLDAVQGDDRAELSKVLDITRTDDATAAVRKVKDGDIAAAVEQRGDQLVVHYSAADTVRAATVRSVFNQLALQSGGAPPKVALDMRQVEDTSLKAIQYVTPGLLGWAIATGATFGAAMTLVNWRRKQILRRLRLSPVRTSSIVTARVVVSLGVALLQTAIFLGVASLPYFGLHLADAWWMSIVVILAGTLSFLSIGLLAGALAKTEEAANVMVNLIVLPMAFLSGSFFPLDNAPGWLRGFAEILPLRHLNTAMLDVMVRGKGPLSVLPEVGILLGFAVVLSAIAVWRFRWDEV
ncbi:ABC transporter permease [Dactylosporangium aurantiacum]|uniref:Transport permease protein n=1 Tax=Dactylosporangium aurantiacum TaxID=35754 RepID=A0A9Q9MIR1_9ACTN|nr:ABC transporter permease [Dactylosporangium aurantiacum]MDG6106313.1 ABC transporter permease [Dactylosporangium aurantiacum]UWZ58194.1 ABC transporter permease [Dactylosporangium aurantiacum]